jgi:hypothetical protein
MAGMTTNDIRVMKFIDDKHAEYVKKMQAAAPGAFFTVLVQFQPVTKSMVDHSRASGGNVLGLEEVVAKGPGLMWLIAVTVDTAANQKKIAPLTLEYRNAVNAYATKIGANKDWVYLNYALGDQDPISHYGAANIKLLKDASKKYDPKGAFQKLRSSGFKLPA